MYADNKARIQEAVRIEIKNDLMDVEGIVGSNVIAERIATRIVDRIDDMVEVSERATSGYSIADSMGSCYTDGWRAAMRYVNAHHGLEVDLG